MDSERSEEGRRRALAHPTRREILGRLAGSGLSDQDLGAALGGESLALLAYHLGVLERADLVRRAGDIVRAA